MRSAHLLVLLALATAAPTVLVACGDPNTAAGQGLSPEATKWLDRARASYKSGDLDDARDAADSALAAAPKSDAVKIVAARTRLARLEYAEVERILQGVDSSEARGLRGRAKWYAGEVEQAADELEAMLQDPNVKDEWAKTIARLARRGAGRKPFEISGAPLALSPMPKGRGMQLIVPLEIDGEQVFAMVATGKGEVVLDSASRKEPSWIQLRFGERIEVSNVPALVEDLSGVSKEVGAPIRALLGVNLLRRLNVTFDFTGEQFIVRQKEPAPPPRATRIPLFYAQGGAMMMRIGLKQDAPLTIPMLVNSQMPFPVALDDQGWKDAGVDLSTLNPVQGEREGKLKATTLPLLKLGAFQVPGVPAFQGPTFADAKTALGVDVEGALGAGLLAFFRCSLADNGRAIWIEDLPEEILQMLQPEPNQGPPGKPPVDGPSVTPPSSAPALPPPAPLPPPTTKPAPPANPANR